MVESVFPPTQHGFVRKSSTRCLNKLSNKEASHIPKLKKKLGARPQGSY